MTTIIIAYLLYLLVIGGFAVAAIYHARRFGFPGDRTTLATGTYLLAVVVIIAFTFVVLAGLEVTGIA